MTRTWWPSPPMWSCARCRGEYLTTQPIHTCASCDLLVCSTCYDPGEDRCHPCSDALYLSEDDLLDLIHRVPDLCAVEYAVAARFVALGGGEVRVPLASWYLGRVKALLSDLVKSGHVVCAWDGCLSHRERRESAEIMPLCEWRLGPAGEAYFREAVTA